MDTLKASAAPWINNATSSSPAGGAADGRRRGHSLSRRGFDCRENDLRQFTGGEKNPIISSDCSHPILELR